MALDTNVELLEQAAIFHGLAPQQLTAIAVKARKAFFQEGESLIRADACGNTAYIILSGSAAVQSEAGTVPDGDALGPGALIGELAMLVETSYPVTVTATERVRAMAIDREALYEVMEADPSIAQHFSEKLIERLLTLVEELRGVDARFASLESSLDDVIASATGQKEPAVGGGNG